MISTTLIMSLAASFVLVGLARNVARRSGLVDVPNARSSHIAPTPRGGGIAIVIVTLSVAMIDLARHPDQHETLNGSLIWILGGGLIAVTGALDDIRGLSVTSRIIAHATAAVFLLLVAGGLPQLPGPHGPVDLGPLGWALGAAAIIWSINLFNFMDGIDGLAAAQAIFVFGSAALLLAYNGAISSSDAPILAVAAASAGFLVWNFPPAKIFLGDVGSGFLGFAVAAGAFLTAGHGQISLWTWLALNGSFVADATMTLTTRLLRGQCAYEAHRSHAYQRLSRRWKSQLAVVGTYAAINLAWCLPWAAATLRYPSVGPYMAIIVLVPLFLIAVAAGAGRDE
jgi:Fuc2NAc and GlcNAc transferase